MNKSNRKMQEKVARRMVALALEPYLNSRRKFDRLYRQATFQTIEEAHAESALKMLHIRHEMRAIGDSIDDLSREINAWSPGRETRITQGAS